MSKGREGEGADQQESREHLHFHGVVF
jgi:hypothetical protein